MRGRPHGAYGAVRIVLLRAVAELTTANTGPTMRELAHHTQVGIKATSYALSNLVRAEVLVIVRHRRVAHCKKRSAEYATAKEHIPRQNPVIELAAALAAWR